MCCGIATGGKLCSDGVEACTTQSDDTPNIMVCNNKDTAVDFIFSQANFDSTKTLYAKYLGTGFSCMSGAKTLAAAGVALIATASMMWAWSDQQQCLILWDSIFIEFMKINSSSNIRTYVLRHNKNFQYLNCIKTSTPLKQLFFLFISLIFLLISFYKCYHLFSDIYFIDL